jgi:hypothetical protein
VQVQAMPDGSLRAISGNALLATTAPAVMWDSRRDAAGTGRVWTAVGLAPAPAQAEPPTQRLEGQVEKVDRKW